MNTEFKIDRAEERKSLMKLKQIYNVYLCNITARVKEIEMGLYMEVSKATITTDGKDGEKVDKLEFTNERLRDNETSRRAKDNAECQVLNDQLLQNITESHEAQVETDFLKRQLKSLELVIEITKIKLRIA